MSKGRKFGDEFSLATSAMATAQFASLTLHTAQTRVVGHLGTPGEPAESSAGEGEVCDGLRVQCVVGGDPSFEHFAQLLPSLDREPVKVGSEW